MTKKKIRILGIRGIPAAHGGFETFAENLSLHLSKRDWEVTVYCQEDGKGSMRIDDWQGVKRIIIPIKHSGPVGTIFFDWKSTWHAAKCTDLCLTLGYNTAVFGVLLKLKGIPNLINMDGIEWARAKWGPIAKLWFWLNERAGCWLGDHLIADHPEIKKHLSTRISPSKITTIAYGAPALSNTSSAPLHQLGVEPEKYLSVIARPEPENSLLEIVKGFSSKTRGVKLLVLGNYDQNHPYHAEVKRAASTEVYFVGAIYDKATLNSIRVHSLAYVHGHQVGGTNPSLVEALGAGNAVFAHDNRFNRWVAEGGALYFNSADQFSALLDESLNDETRLNKLRSNAKARFLSALTWPQILSEYEKLLINFLPRTASDEKFGIANPKG